MKRIIILIISVCIVLFALVGITGVASAHEVQPSGNGVDLDPYQVTNWHELAYMNQDLSSNYQIQNNITSSTSGYDEHVSNQSGGWNPVGDSNTAFTGELDFNRYHIDDLFINRPSLDDIGLIATTDNANIRGGQLTSVNITGGYFTGSLIGSSTNSIVENVSATGKVDGDSRVAGLIGRSNGGSINNSYATVSVNSNGNNIGGLVGENRGGSSINNSYATGSVTGNDNVGGFVGYNTGSDSSITNSYATGSVTGNDNVGGLVADNRGSVSSSYWDKESTGQDSTNGGGTGLTTNQMQGSSATSNMSAFDFNSTWETVEDQDTDAGKDGYPILQSQDRDAQLLAQGADVQYHNLTVDTEDGNESVDTDYEIVDSNGNTAASGQTGSDGSATEELEEGNYNVIVAQNDSYYETSSADVFLNSDQTVAIGLSPTQYNLTVETIDTSGNPINTTFEIAQDSSVVVSNQTGSDGIYNATLDKGEYAVSVAQNDPQYSSGSTTLNLTSDLTTTFERDPEQYDLTINAVDENGSSVDTGYTIVNESNSQIASGQTGSDGTVTETLEYGEYQFSLASEDDRYERNETSLFTLDSDQTRTLTVNPSTYELTINTSGKNTTYRVVNSDGFEVASGVTGDDGEVVETVEYGQYNVTTSEDDPTYERKSRSTTVDSDTTQTFDPAKSSYTIEIGAEDEYENVETDYEVIDSDGNVVASGTTDPNGTVKETLESGDYTVEYANGDRELYSQSQSVVLDSDETVTPTLDRVYLDLFVNESVIYTGQEATFNADVSNADDSTFDYDWYINDNLVASNHSDVLNYTFYSGDTYKIRVEAEIDGNRYVATRPLPKQAWEPTDDDSDESGGSSEERKIGFDHLQISTFADGNPVVARHTVNANLYNLTGDGVSERVTVTKKAQTTDWQVIRANYTYVIARHPEYPTNYYEAEAYELSSSPDPDYRGVRLYLNSTSNGSHSPPPGFGYQFSNDATIIDRDGSSDDNGGFLPSIVGFGSDGGLSAWIPILVVGASLLFIIGSLSLLAILLSLTTGETLGLEDLPPSNLLDWFDD